MEAPSADWRKVGQSFAKLKSQIKQEKKEKKEKKLEKKKEKKEKKEKKREKKKESRDKFLQAGSIHLKVTAGDRHSSEKRPLLSFDRDENILREFKLPIHANGAAYTYSVLGRSVRAHRDLY